MPEAVKISAPLTARQQQLIQHPARVLWVGTGTKTGKTIAEALWMTEGLLAGELCAWVGPWFQRSRSTFEIFKSLLAPMIASGEVKATEGLLRIRAEGGGGIDCYSGDNPEALFGGNYSRVVLDEASRMPEKCFTAALTVTSATCGKVRCSFNVELGSKNWAIRNLLRVQAMSPEQRKALGEDFMCFPTGGEGLVDPALIEALRAQMPEPLWRALYLAEIPESDTSLFRNLDRVFSGQELEAPIEGGRYVAGIDLGRKRDWTVITILDSRTNAVVAGDRFHEISWSLQTQRCASLYKKFLCSKAAVDATGIGDPVTEELSKLGLRVDPFIFTQPSRKALLEGLILACDNGRITVPANNKFAVYRREMEMFEYQLDGQSVRYAAPENCHDDCVMSLALAHHAGEHAGPRLTYSEWVLEQLTAQEESAKKPAAIEACPKCLKTTCQTKHGPLMRCGFCGTHYGNAPVAPPVGGRRGMFDDRSIDAQINCNLTRNPFQW